MTPSEINRAIAESVGWEFIPCHDDGFGRAVGETWLDPDGDIGLVPPDYHGDLNAIHEVETMLLAGPQTDTLGVNYWNTLWHVCDDSYKKLSTIGNATAPQRCEAYLKTIGKWRNE